jgi:hypothetical protein
VVGTPAKLSVETDEAKERDRKARQEQAAAAKKREAEAPWEPSEPEATPAPIEPGVLAGRNETREQASSWQRRVEWGEKLFGEVAATPSPIRQRDQRAAKESASDNVKPLPAAPLRIRRNTPAADAATKPDVPKLRRDPRPPIKIDPQPRGILRQPGAGRSSPAKTVKFTEDEYLSEEKSYDNRESGRLNRASSRRVAAEMKRRKAATAELWRLHKEAKKLPLQPFVETDRFLNLMTIAQDKGPAEAHRLAIQLYRKFQSKSDSDDWTKDAELILHAQLQGLSQTDAVNALEPVIAHFDRYKVLEDNTDDKVFLGLIQLGAILHRIRRDVTIGAPNPPDSRTSF